MAIEVVKKKNKKSPKADREINLTVQVAEKSKKVSIYYGGKYPATLSKEVWREILKKENRTVILDFIKEAEDEGEFND